MNHTPPSRSPVAPALFRRLERVGRLLEAKGLVCATDGNLSLRDGPAGIVITAAGSHKGELRPEDVLRVDRTGVVYWGTKPPSSETAMHLVIYEKRPDVEAVVHAHPPVATAYAVTATPLETRAMPESFLTLGRVAQVPYATPGTEDLPMALEPFLGRHEVFLLSNHGAVTVGKSLEEAYDQMTRLEHAARILFLSRLLGEVEPLAESDLSRLSALQASTPDRHGEPGPGNAYAAADRSRFGAYAGGVEGGTVDAPPELARLIAQIVSRRLAGEGGRTG